MGKADELRNKIDALKRGWSRDASRLDEFPAGQGDAGPADGSPERLEARAALEALRRSMKTGPQIPPPAATGDDDAAEAPPDGEPNADGIDGTARAGEADRADADRRLIYRRDLPPVRQARAPARRTPTRHVALADAVDVEDVRVPGCGTAAVVATRLEELGEESARLGPRLRDALLEADSPASEHFARLGEKGRRIEDLLFVDLETTGLGSTPVFLVGTMAWEDADLLVRQFFARTYAEERAILSLFVDCARARRTIVSFNGKSFDVPYLRVRCAATGVPFACPAAHLDLLHEGRRAWKHTLPDCRLQTLETHICGRRRYGDIPGWAIPDAYHEYVRTANAVEMVEVLKHNLLDLVTLADLLLRLPGRT